MKTPKFAGICLPLLVAGITVAGSVVKADAKAGAGHEMGMSAMDMKSRNRQMLIQTLSEEKTEVRALTAQQAAFRRMGGAENNRIANMYGRWVREHKAAAPTLERLIRQNGGNPASATFLKPPVLGDKHKMLMAIHMDHVAAVKTSQARRMQTNSAAIRAAMNARITLASKHLRQMAPFHKG
jgi:hypothetical protein